MSSLYETLFRRVLFPVYESGLRRRRTVQYLDAYERDQWLAPEQIAALQWRRLQALLAHCWEQVPYYRRRWSEVGAEPGDIRSMADFERLPSLSKDDIRSNFNQLVATDRRTELLIKTTGGSTGQPLRFGYDHCSYERRTAVMWRGYGWASMAIGRRAAYLWGTPIGGGSRLLALKNAAFDTLMNRRMFDAFSMREDNLRDYADAIAACRPQVVVAYVRPIFELARWMNATGYRSCRPASIITGAEALRAHERREIEAAFGCQVFDTYGCREFMLIASECPEHNGLHVNADHMVVEIESPQPGSGLGEMLITDLHNFAMPFVRYRNGDISTAKTGVCACGRGLPRLSRIDGRKLDALMAPGGRIVPGEFFPHLIKDYDEIRQFQVVQRQLDALSLKYVADDDLTQAGSQQLRDAVMAVFGTEVTLHFERVVEVADSPSGKRRVTINEIGSSPSNHDTSAR